MPPLPEINHWTSLRLDNLESKILQARIMIIELRQAQQILGYLEASGRVQGLDKPTVPLWYF